MRRFISIKLYDCWNVWDNRKQEFHRRWMTAEECGPLCDYLNEQENTMEVADNGGIVGRVESDSSQSLS